MSKGIPSKLKKKGLPFGVIFVSYYSDILFTEYDSNGDFVRQISGTKEDFILRGEVFSQINKSGIDIFVQILDQRVILDHNVMDDVKSSDLSILSKQHLDPTILIGNTYIKKVSKNIHEINSIFLQRIDSDEVCDCIDSLVYLGNKILGISFFNLSMAEFFSKYFNNYSKDKIYATITMDSDFNLYFGAFCHDRALIMRNDKISNTDPNEVRDNILRQIKTSVRYLTNRVPDASGLDVTVITHGDIFDEINGIDKCKINVIKEKDFPYKLNNKDGSIDIIGSLRFVTAKHVSYFSITNKILKLHAIRYNLRKSVLPAVLITLFAISAIIYKAFFTENEARIKISLSKKYISDISEYIDNANKEIGDKEKVKSMLDVYKTYNMSQLRRSAIDDYNIMSKITSKISNISVVSFEWSCNDNCLSHKSFSSKMMIRIGIYNKSGYIDDMTNLISETSASLKRQMDKVGTIEQVSNFNETFVRGKSYNKAEIDYKIIIKHG